MKYLAPAHRRHGITLVEAMVTLAIIGILLAVAIPNLSDYIHRKRMEGVANELISDLALMRVESVSKTVDSARAFIQIGNGSKFNCYTIYIDDPLGGAVCDCTKPAGQACTQDYRKNNEIKVVQLPEKLGIKFSTNAAGNQAEIDRGSRLIPAGFKILIEGNRPGAIRLDLNAAGRPEACSPDGLLHGYPKCP
jgi:prepilin-type N-terminal cleavage/methylation domain-containing protein